ncbi:UNKNOWN [Stylonychia lemnae]|uniref:Arrestin-like N-terminal domain-containing protein n=1 Tax=Stylonychia lemnae TaxID=5949 RepID=A0A078AUZ6_STYLE|nr:UNKNOWN [Stylonychia lemnae]|eukprot:CDW86029.1 UNKNOWN [Stylonychia lemnae]
MTEDITGRIIIEMKKDYNRSGLLVVSLDGKEQFEYAPINTKSNHIHRNENKFLREREALAQFDRITQGHHTFNFNFTQNGGSKRPPTINFQQDIKGTGVIDIQCSYKLGVAIYDTNSGIDKIMKKEHSVIIRDHSKKVGRKNFIEVGQSYVQSCLGSLGSGGISSFQIKCEQDHLQNSEKIKILNKIDNTKSKQRISRVQVKLIRQIRLHTGNISTSSAYDTLLSQTIWKKSYDGIQPKTRDRDFNRLYEINLDEIFEKERESSLKFREYTEDNDISDANNLISIIPSSFGRIFMVQYSVQVSLLHQSFFSKKTCLDIDVNIELSDKDFENEEIRLKKYRNKSYRFNNGP